MPHCTLALLLNQLSSEVSLFSLGATFSSVRLIFQLYSGDVIQPMQSSPTYPLVYNQYLYYLSSLESRKRFLENPIEYIFNQPVSKPVVPFQIAVIGPPKSGKTTSALLFICIDLKSFA